MGIVENMSNRPLLVIGHYLEDSRSLLRVTKAAQKAFGVTPIFLITSVDALREPAIQAITEAGYEVFNSLPPATTLDQVIRNPFKRVRLTLEENTALSGRILAAIKPAAILCTGDAAHGTLVKTARAQGIPSLFFQWTEIHSLEVHEAWRRAESQWFDRQTAYPLRLRHRLRRYLERLAKARASVPPWWPYYIPATRLAVAGPYYRSMCIRAGIQPGKVVVTGNPQCDDMAQYAKLSAEERKILRQTVGISDNRAFVLYAREHVGRIRHLALASAIDSERMIIRAIQKAAPKCALVVRLHPKEGKEELERIHALGSGIQVIGNDLNIGEVIAASDLVISTVSSSLLWAIGLDTPAISAFFWRGVEEFKMRRHWIGVEKADTFDDLVEAIENNLNNPNHQRLWQRQRDVGRSKFLMLDGKSIERIVEQLGMLLRGHE